MLALAALLANQAFAQNPCTNGSFEELDPSGFPRDWAPVGQQVGASETAHSGARSLRMVRSASAPSGETGLNRAYPGGSGGGGAMIDRLKGGLEFWYQAVAADAAELCVYAIPMSAEAVEDTGSPRAVFRVPADHVGDGQWHPARLQYDFSGNPRVRWVQFAARIVGRGGELLLDDVAYLESVGPLLRVSSLVIEEDAALPGQRGVLRAAVENAGDRPLDAFPARIELPAGLTTPAAEVRVESLAPGQRTRVAWTLEGHRASEQAVRVTVGEGESATSGRLLLQPRLTLRSFGPQTPVAAAELPIALQCELRNEGTACVLSGKAAFRCGSETGAASIAEIPPGKSVVLESRFIPMEQATALPVSVSVRADNVAGERTAASVLVVGATFDAPPETGRLEAIVNDRCALLRNREVRLMFPRNAFGFGTAELAVRRGDRWQPVAWLPRLSQLVYRDPDGTRVERPVFAAEPPQAVVAQTGRLEFRWSEADAGEGRWELRAVFELEPFSNTFSVRHELTCDRPRELLRFEGPMLYVLSRDEAIFPGLEWLIGDEVSSSDLAIAEDHPDRLRYVVHPNMITVPAIGFSAATGSVGLHWDPRQAWDGQRDRPAAVFASPDRFGHQRAHLAGLFLPAVPEFVDRNQTEAARPYPLAAGQPLRLEASLFADPGGRTALDAVERWLGRHGFPQPAPLPHGSYEGEIGFSMQAYLTSLWRPQTKDWWVTKGSPALSTTGRPRAFIVDLMVGAMLSPDASVRRNCRARAEELIALVGGQRRLDAQRFPDRADLAYASPSAASQLLAARRDDGTWRFDADQQPQSGPFVGMDYHRLGPDDAFELGTSARNAYLVLRYARIAGDWEAYEAMRETLMRMERFRVPRAAQVWEVPVHAPDILAAADAVDAYVEAYRFSGEARWLNAAVLWARRGLPFVYLWQDPDQPFLSGASIAVFGATWYRESWFGRPVQWNGLRYADALLRLAEVDQQYPWRQLAEAIVRSAVLQQDQDGENVALWPDNISALDGAKCPWVFAPQQILDLMLKLLGRSAEPMTVQAGVGPRRMHVTAAAGIRSAVHRGAVLSVELEYPEGEEGVVLVSNVSRPQAVFLDGNPIRERVEVERGVEPGWRYDAGNAYLAVRVPKSGKSTVRVEGGIYREVRRLPWPVTEIVFDFANSLDGWLPAHDIAEMSPDNGVLTALISGPDPYLVRDRIRAEGSSVPVLRLRMRTNVGGGGQLFWSTAAAPGFDEQRSLRFTAIPDGEFHEYQLEVGGAANWSGETITGLRLDPCGGTRSGEFGIDYLRAGRR